MIIGGGARLKLYQIIPKKLVATLFWLCFLIFFIGNGVVVDGFSARSLTNPWADGPNGGGGDGWGNGGGRYGRGRRGRRTRKRRRRRQREQHQEDEEEGEGQWMVAGSYCPRYADAMSPLSSTTTTTTTTRTTSSRMAGALFAYPPNSSNDAWNPNHPDDEDDGEEELQDDIASSMLDSSSSSPSDTNLFGSSSSSSSSTSAAGTTLQQQKAKANKKSKWNRTTVNGAAYVEAPNVRNSLKKLIPLTRPSNFPPIILLHMLGTFLALRHVNYQLPLSYWKTIQHPTMIMTLIAIMLTSGTSMVVNDYYDAKLGRDEKNRTTGYRHPVAEGEIPLHVVKTFLSYLYGAALLSLAVVPGIPTRLSVVMGLMITYLYTQHLKPITWIKNFVCAILIALSPVTSASAALHLSTKSSWNVVPLFLQVPSVWRLFGILLLGTFGREMAMDCNDYDADKQANVRTVPVVHGRRYASRGILLLWVLPSVLAVIGPLLQVLNGGATASLMARSRRLLLASAAAMMLIRQGWLVKECEGSDKDVVDRAVDGSMIPLVLFIASSI